MRPSARSARSPVLRSAPPAPGSVPPRRGPIALVAVVTAAILVAACGSTSASGQLLTGQGSRAAPQREFLPGAVVATNELGVDLYRVLATDAGNFSISPLSVMTSLAMARAGSAGSTRQELDVVLHADRTPNLDGGLNALALELDGRTGDKRSATRRGRVEVAEVAGLWGQRGTHVKEPLLDLLAVNYGTGFRVTDFHADAEGSRDAINRWADEGTQGVVRELVPRGGITQYTRFVAASAWMLRAPWQVAFDAGRTRPLPFDRGDGPVDVPMMDIAVPLRAASGEGWRAVEVPYLGDELALDVIVPDRGTFPAFEQGFGSDRLRAVLDAIDDEDPEPVSLTLPVFAFTTTRDLQDPLTALGLRAAFSRDADFSGVTSDEVLSLSSVVYQGFFKVDEEGSDPIPDTATAQPNEPTIGGAQRLLVDRPFVFAVRDRLTGAVLLMGRFVNPT